MPMENHVADPPAFRQTPARAAAFPPSTFATETKENRREKSDDPSS